MYFYKICRGIGLVLFKIFFRFKVTGKENVPNEGKIILCSNHISNIDPVTVGLAFPRQVHFMAKKELFENKFLKWLIENLGAFPVDRKSADLSAIRNSMKILKNEKVLGIFPEGTRVTKPSIDNAKPGVGLICIKGKSPVVPLYIESKYRPFGKIIVKIGKPMYFDEYYNKKMTTDDYRMISQDILKSIYSLKNE